MTKARPLDHRSELYRELLSRAVDRAIEQIRSDVWVGTIPLEVESYGDLHDHTDANWYGHMGDGEDGEWVPDPLCPVDDHEFDDYTSATWFQVLCDMQDVVHYWIRSGGIWDVTGGPFLVQTTEDGTAWYDEQEFPDRAGAEVFKRHLRDGMDRGDIEAIDVRIVPVR
jgi:hypothetical protein